MRRAIQALGLLALILFPGQVSAQPPSADAAAETARQAARSDRHETAIDAFARAIEAAPGRRREWLVELADQLTWSGRLSEAIALYREAAESDDAGQRRHARLGLARALARDGQHAGALAEYQVLLGDQPDDLEAQRGIGRVQSWQGRHRDAAGQMQRLLQDHPHDREATLILAESLAWMGRPDRANRVLRDQAAADRDDERSANFLEDLDSYQRPEARTDWRTFDQTDDLGITVISLDARFHFADGRGFAGPRYDLGVYRPAGAVGEIQVQRPGVQGRYRFNDSLDWHGSLFVDLIDAPGASGDYELPTYETYLTYWANDRLRFDIGSSRWTFDSLEALRAGLTATQANASMDLAPNGPTRLTARVSSADYSDGNERAWWQIEAVRRVWQEPRIMIGYRFTGFDFAAPGQAGYYNPDLYHAHEALLQSWGRLRRDVRWNLAAAAGYETEDPGASRMIWSASGGLAWEMAPRLELEAAYDYSSSATASTGGFARGIGRLTLRRRF